MSVSLNTDKRCQMAVFLSGVRKAVSWFTSSMPITRKVAMLLPGTAYDMLNLLQAETTIA